MDRDPQRVEAVTLVGIELEDPDLVVAAGSQARFMDAGLVYADGTRLNVVPFERLPL